MQKFKPASPLASDGYTPLAKGIGEGRIERSDLSPSPSHADDGKSRYLSLKRYDLSQVDDKDRPSQLHQEESGGGEASLRAELRQKTKQVSELQSKLAEASKKVEQAGHKALGDKATQMQLASQKGERDRRIELLETSLSEEKRHAEESKKQSAELKFQCEEHEATLRTMRLELHQKTLDFDRIRHQSLRTQSEGEIEAKRMLVQTKDELVAHKAEIVEIKSILYVHQKKEMELKKELQAKEDALEELGQKEQSLTEALRQSKLLNSENSLKLDQTKSEYQIKYDKLEQQKEQGVSEAIRQCKLQIGELQLKMDKAKSEYQLNVDKLEQEIRIHNETNHDLVRKLAEAESDMSEMRSRLNQSQLQLDKDGALIEALELDLSTLAGLDDSLKAAAAAERQRCKDLQEKILHLNQQLVLSDAKQSSQHDRVLVQQKHIETLKQDLQTEQENCSWLRKELHKTNRELLEKNSMINADYLQDTVLTMDATLQATERHMAVVSLLANQRCVFVCVCFWCV